MANPPTYWTFLHWSAIDSLCLCGVSLCPASWRLWRLNCVRNIFLKNTCLLFSSQRLELNLWIVQAQFYAMVDKQWAFLKYGCSNSVWFVLLSTLYFFLSWFWKGKKRHAGYSFIIVRTLLFPATASSTNIHLVCISQAFKCLTTRKKLLFVTKFFCKHLRFPWRYLHSSLLASHR